MVMLQTAGSLGTSYEVAANMCSAMHHLWIDVHGTDSLWTSATLHSDHCHV